LQYYYYVDIQHIVVFKQHLVVNTTKFYLMLIFIKWSYW